MSILFFCKRLGSMETFVARSDRKSTALWSSSWPRILAFDPSGLFLSCVDQMVFKILAFDRCGLFSAASIKRLRKIAAENRPRKKFLWNSTVKNHFTWHYGDQSFYINPDIVWCFGFEDFVGKIANISVSCTHGRSLDSISSAVCAKYLLYMSILMREFQEAAD